jgi:hypothetical protein
MEKFFPFMGKSGASYRTFDGKPVFENGKRDWQPLDELNLDDAGAELFKTNFYQLESWDVETGLPTRKCLGEIELKNISDTTISKEKLGP